MTETKVVELKISGPESCVKSVKHFLKEKYPTRWESRLLPDERDSCVHCFLYADVVEENQP